MILDVVQSSMEMYAREFKILRGGVNVGNVFLKGSLGSMDARVVVDLFGVTYEMHRDTWCVSQDPKMIRYFRPYRVSVLPRSTKLGTVTQIDRKLGWFKRRSYLSCVIGSDVYEDYGICLGNDGFKSFIYLKDKPVAEIDMDNTVVDERYNYKVYCKDARDSVAAVLLTVYSYILAGYHPGEKVTKSMRITYSKTTDKFMLGKYVSDFTKGIKV